MAGGSGKSRRPSSQVGVNVSHTCEATFGVPGRGGKGRGGARASRKRGVATDARGLPAFQVLDEIAPTARQVGVNHGAAQLDTVGDYLHYQWELSPWACLQANRHPALRSSGFGSPATHENAAGSPGTLGKARGGADGS